MSNKSQNWLLFFLNLMQSNFGISLFSIALAFLVLEQTHSPKQMTLTFACSYLPLFLVPITTTWFDRLKLKMPLLIICLLRGVLILTFILLIKSPKIFWIYFLAFADAMLVTIYSPTNQALIPFIFPKYLLNKGNGFYSLIKNGIPALGFLFGGIIVSIYGPRFAMTIYALSCIISVLLLAYIDIPSLPINEQNTEKNFIDDFILGFKLLFEHKQLLAIVVIALFLNTFVLSLFDIQLPFYMTQIGKGAKGVGMFNTFITLGIACGGLSMIMIGHKFKATDGTILSFILTTIAFFGLAFATAYPVILGLVFFLGFTVGINDCYGLLFLQQLVPLNCMVRVNGLIFTLVQIGKPIFLFSGSGLIAKLTMHKLYFIGTIISLAATIAWSIIKKHTLAHGS